MGRKRADADNKLPPGLYLRGQTYYIRFKAQGRWVYERCTGNYLRAARRLAELRDDAERGQLGLPKKVRVTLKDFSERYLEWARQHKRSAKRDEYALRKILPELGHLLLPQVDKVAVQAFLAKRREEVSPATCNRDLALLKGMLSRAVDFGLMETNPLHRVKGFAEPPGRTPNLSADDEARILDASPPWLRELIKATLVTGARLGELTALRWRDIAFDERLILIPDSKNQEPRRVPLPDELYQAIHPRRGVGDGPVFTLPNGRPIPVQTASHAFNRVVKRLKLPLRFHDLRHCTASRLLHRGASIIQLQDLLGHKSAILARRYAHTQMSDLRRLMEDAAGTGNGVQ